MYVALSNARVVNGMVAVALLLSLCLGCSNDKPSGPEESGYRVVSTVPLPDIGRKAALDGDRLYIACQDSGLVVMDVSDPASAHPIARLEFPGMAYHVTIDGSTAYVTTSHDGALHTVDISDPSAPRILDTYVLPNQSERTCCRDGLALTATADALIAIDVSNPSALSDLGFDASICGYDAKFVSAAVGSDLAVATDGADLVTLDVSNPSSLVIRDRYELPDLIYGIWSEGALIYAAHRYEGLSILSTDGNGSLNLVGSLALPGGNARDVTLSGSVAFVASSEGATAYAIDVTSSANPRLIWNLAGERGSKGLAADARHLFVLGGDTLTIVRR